MEDALATLPEPSSTKQHVLERADLPRLFAILQGRGFRTVGPTVQDAAIVYDDLATDADLPIGWTDEQDGGHYRLRRRDDAAVFGYAVGPHSWKKYLFPPAVRLWSADRKDGSFAIRAEPVPEQKLAFIGVRACELRAIRVQDRVFVGAYKDPRYSSVRDSIFIVAVNCGSPAGTCFCVSMNAGPRAQSGFDLALTEVLETGRHYFVVEIGSEMGATVLAEIPNRAAEPGEEAAALMVVERAGQKMGRTLDAASVKELLYSNLENARWDEVAERCLTCANCTMVCPTCFCSTVEDVTDLTGDHAERWRKWDSCFTMDFTQLAGGTVRSSGRSRYRQWITHKLATWHDQFGTSGCVGCGRCITWCPVGIDITEEVAAVRRSVPDILPYRN
jgi:sulfhydrogenase subunit beta (sulfur reductase)